MRSVNWFPVNTSDWSAIPFPLFLFWDPKMSKLSETLPHCISSIAVLVCWVELGPSPLVYCHLTFCIWSITKYVKPLNGEAISGCQLLIFKKKKVFFKRFQFLKKKEKVLSQEKKFFLHQQFQILELKKRVCFKKKEVFFSLPISYTSSR